MVSEALNNNTSLKIKTNVQSEILKSQFQGCQIPVSAVDGNATYLAEQNENTFQCYLGPKSPR